MIWAQLLIWTCALGGGNCQAHTVAIMPALQCNIVWQMEAAKFIAEHPDRRFQKYECLPGTGGA